MGDLQAFVSDWTEYFSAMVEGARWDQAPDRAIAEMLLAEIETIEEKLREATDGQ